MTRTVLSTRALNRYGQAAAGLQEACATVEALKGEVARAEEKVRWAEEGEQRALNQVTALEQAQVCEGWRR